MQISLECLGKKSAFHAVHERFYVNGDVLWTIKQQEMLDLSLETGYEKVEFFTQMKFLS